MLMDCLSFYLWLCVEAVEGRALHHLELREDLAGWRADVIYIERQDG